jgi:hypothetical protein
MAVLLCLAQEKGQTGIVQILKNASRKTSDIGEDKNVKLLIVAAMLGQTARVEALLAMGVDVNAIYKEGRTALIGAASSGHTMTVQVLLAAGADVNAKDAKGVTALGAASAEGYASTVEALLAAGADVNAKAKNGGTALTLAKRKGSAEVVQILKNAGATDTVELGVRKKETAVEVKLGLDVQDLTLVLADKFKIKDQKGVLVNKVEPGSVAQERGLREGDLIKEVNRQAVASAEEFKNAVTQVKKGESVLLRVVRENRAFYAVLSPEEK